MLADLRAGTDDAATTARPSGGGDDPAAGGQDDPAAEDRATLVVLSREYEALDPAPTGSGFAAWLTAAVRSGDSRSVDAVEVSTFHAAKGLEWPVVHVAGLEDGLVPIGWATTPDAEAEERRLLYVALTRAEHELRLHRARTRATAGGEPRPRDPSPWLAAVETTIAELAAAETPVDGRHHLRPEHEALRARHPEDHAPEVEALDRLRAWRAEAAHAARVPAEAIVDDPTLHAIADARPTTTEELGAIPGLGAIKAARFGPALLAAVHPDGH